MEITELKINVICYQILVLKKNNKLLITKNLFKQKSRKAIQNATVKRTLEIIKSMI